MTTYYIVVIEKRDGGWRVFGDGLGETFMANHFKMSKMEAENLAEIHHESTLLACKVVEVREDEVEGI